MSRFQLIHPLHALLYMGLAACSGEPAMELGSSAHELVSTESELFRPASVVAREYFGASVAADGTTVAVGATGADENGWGSGKAYVYSRSAGAWQLEASLLPATVGQWHRFGDAIGIQGDHLAISAPGGFESSGDTRGAVYMFQRANGAWLEQARLEPPDDPAIPDPGYGQSLALDGTTLIVGAADEDGNSGAAYVYEYDGATWVKTARLTAPLNSYNYDGDFGMDVALQGDTAVVSAPRYMILDPSTQRITNGIVFVYTRTGTSWQLSAELRPHDPRISQLFGLRGLAIDDDTILVGSNFGGYDSAGDGATYVFVRDASGVWTEQAKLVPRELREGEYDDYEFGSSAFVSGDLAVIGAPYAAGYTGAVAGGAFVFVRRDGVWIEREKLVAQSGAIGEYVGTSVALLDGLALVGAPFVSNPAGGGGVYVFPVGDGCSDAAPGSWNYCSADCPCTEGQGDCDTDADCATGHFCLHDGGFAYGASDPELDVCVPYCPSVGAGAVNFCSQECPCSEGEGDCDSSSECEDGLKCLSNVGTDFGYDDPELDVCACPLTGQGGSSFCSETCPCDVGEGDCDGDNECADGLVCNRDVGAAYGWAADVDVCEAISASLVAAPRDRVPAEMTR